MNKLCFNPQTRRRLRRLGENSVRGFLLAGCELGHILLARQPSAYAHPLGVRGKDELPEAAPVISAPMAVSTTSLDYRTENGIEVVQAGDLSFEHLPGQFVTVDQHENFLELSPLSGD